MIYVFGHQNPDSDSICSALITADWLTNLGKRATPFRLGDITPETAFILQQAGVAPPPCSTKTSVANRYGWSTLPIWNRALPHLPTATLLAS